MTTYEPPLDPPDDIIPMYVVHVDYSVVASSKEAAEQLVKKALTTQDFFDDIHYTEVTYAESI